MRQYGKYSLVLSAFARLTTGISLNLTSLYGPGLSPAAEIFYASNANFSTEVTQRWTIYGEPTFYGAIKPATVQDVQHIVKISSANNIPFLPTGAGHGSSITLAKLQQGLQVDLSNFNSVSMDLNTKLITVGGAAVFSQLYQPLYDSGTQLPLGNALCVGVIGATLGGTVGAFQGLYGLGLDSLVSVTLVTASGDVVNASNTENADLFWGIRGAGSNFGIVVSAVFQAHEAPNGGNLTSADFIFPGSANASVWEALKAYDDDIQNELTLNLYVIYNSTSKESNIYVNAEYFGPISEATEYLKPLYSIGPLATDVVSTPWIDYQSVALFGEALVLDSTSCVDGQDSNGYSLGLKDIDVPTFVSFFNNATTFWGQYPEVSGVWVIERYPNNITESFGDGSTAYPHRAIKTHLTFEHSYDSANTTLDTAVNAFVQSARADFQRTSGFEHLSVYVNFAHGDEGVEAWYSDRKMERLSELKRIWDPNQLFSWYNPIPLYL